MVCEYYAYQTTAQLMETIPTRFELRVCYDWRATALKLSPKWFGFPPRHFFGFSPNNCGHGTYSQATPRELNPCIKGSNEFARN